MQHKPHYERITLGKIENGEMNILMQYTHSHELNELYKNFKGFDSFGSHHMQI